MMGPDTGSSGHEGGTMQQKQKKKTPTERFAEFVHEYGSEQCKFVPPDAALCAVPEGIYTTAPWILLYAKDAILW